MIYLVFFFSVISAVAMGYLAAAVSYNIVIILALAVTAGLIAFFSPRGSLVLLICSMLLSPELGMGAVAGGRSAVLRYDDILVVIMFFSWLARSAIIKDKPFVTDTPVQTPILIYISICVLSTALGVLRGDVRFETASFYVLKYVEYFLIYFMTVNIVDSKEEVKKYLKYGLWVAIIVTFYAYYYYANAGADARAGAPFEAPIGKPSESEPASLGGYYLIIFGLLLSLLAELPDRRFFLILGLFSFMFPAFLVTYSRASYMGFVAMTLAFFAILRKRRLLVLVFMGIAISGVSMDLFERAKNRITMTYEGELATQKLSIIGRDINLEESAFQRYISLRTVLTEKLPKHPVLGWGVTGVGLGDNHYALVLGETGLAGFFVFLWMLYRIYRAALSVYKTHDDPWVRGLAFGLVLALIGLLTQCVGVNTFIIVRIMEPFWFLTALVMALYKDMPNTAKTNPADQP